MDVREGRENCARPTVEHSIGFVSERLGNTCRVLPGTLPHLRRTVRDIVEVTSPHDAAWSRTHNCAVVMFISQPMLMLPSATETENT